MSPNDFETLFDDDNAPPIPISLEEIVQEFCQPHYLSWTEGLKVNPIGATADAVEIRVIEIYFKGSLLGNLIVGLEAGEPIRTVSFFEPRQLEGKSEGAFFKVNLEKLITEDQQDDLKEAWMLHCDSLIRSVPNADMERPVRIFKKELLVLAAQIYLGRENGNIAPEDCTHSEVMRRLVLILLSCKCFITWQELASALAKEPDKSSNLIDRQRVKPRLDAFAARKSCFALFGRKTDMVLDAITSRFEL